MFFEFNLGFRLNKNIRKNIMVGQGLSHPCLKVKPLPKIIPAQTLLNSNKISPVSLSKEDSANCKV